MADLWSRLAAPTAVRTPDGQALRFETDRSARASGGLGRAADNRARVEARERGGWLEVRASPLAPPFLPLHGARIGRERDQVGEDDHHPRIAGLARHRVSN